MSAEVVCSPFRAMRQSYIQNGGNDPAVLAQIADMEAEAMGLPQKRHRDKARQNIGKTFLVYH